MASKKSGERAAAAWDSPLVKRRNNLIERKIPLRADEGENLPRVLLQWRGTPSTGHGFASPVFTKALDPADRRTDAEIKPFGRLPSGPSLFNEVDDARSLALSMLGSMHMPIFVRRMLEQSTPDVENYARTVARMVSRGLHPRKRAS